VKILFFVQVRGTHIIEDGTTVFAAVCEDGIAILDHQTLQQISKYCYAVVETFGGAIDDHFMLVVDDNGHKRRLLFGSMTKHKARINNHIIYIYELIHERTIVTTTQLFCFGHRYVVHGFYEISHVIMDALCLCRYWK